jgi:hypothetical protein
MPSELRARPNYNRVTARSVAHCSKFFHQTAFEDPPAFILLNNKAVVLEVTPQRTATQNHEFASSRKVVFPLETQHESILRASLHVLVMRVT